MAGKNRVAYPAGAFFAAQPRPWSSPSRHEKNPRPRSGSRQAPARQDRAWRTARVPPGLPRLRRLRGNLHRTCTYRTSYDDRGAQCRGASAAPHTRLRLPGPRPAARAARFTRRACVLVLRTQRLGAQGLYLERVRVSRFTRFSPNQHAWIPDAIIRSNQGIDDEQCRIMNS